MKKLLFIALFLSSAFAQANPPADASIEQVASDAGCVIEIKTGWNLVGSSNMKMFIEIAQSSTAEIISAWKWNKTAKKWEFFEPTKPYYGQVYAKNPSTIFSPNF